MGNTFCACSRSTTSEEDFISIIFSKMTITKQETNRVYSKFLSCLENDNSLTNSITLNSNSNKTNSKQKQTLNSTKYGELINSFIDQEFEFNYLQLKYFENLTNLNDIPGIKRIGNMIIFLSEGTFSEKSLLLEKHINNYYGSQDRHMNDFICDVVDSNTEICLLSFKDNMEGSVREEMMKIWKKPSKQKLINKLMGNYREIKSTTKDGRDPVTTQSLFYKFLLSNYNALMGDSIRCYLSEDYNNK